MESVPDPKKPGRDVFVFPAKGTYSRLPLDHQENGDFSFKLVKVTDREGRMFRIVFIDPKMRRDGVED